MAKMGNLPEAGATNTGANESTPAAERESVTAKSVTLASGPKVDEATKAYLPASYKTQNGCIRHDR